MSWRNLRSRNGSGDNSDSNIRLTLPFNQPARRYIDPTRISLRVHLHIVHHHYHRYCIPPCRLFLTACSNRARQLRTRLKHSCSTNLKDPQLRSKPISNKSSLYRKPKYYFETLRTIFLSTTIYCGRYTHTIRKGFNSFCIWQIYWKHISYYPK